MLNGKAKILSIILCILGILISISSTGIAASPSIVRYSSDWPVLIDPSVGSDVQSMTAIVNLFDPLVFVDTKGNIIPHVAKSWDISSDGLTYTFYLRPGIKFHDGSELTAEDVKFSMDRNLKIGEGIAYLWLGKIQETKVIDKYKVVFHMKTVFGPFLSTLPSFFIVNKKLIMANIKKPGMYDDMGDYAKVYASAHDVGSGPYMIKNFSAEYILMEKNPNYFLDIASAPDEFEMIASTEPTLVKTLMARRELEMTNRWMGSETLESLAKIEGIKVTQWRASNMEYITMNTKKPPLDDIHVRKALAWAFDYDAAVKLSPGSVQARGPVSLTVPGSDPNCFQYHRDLNRAKMELKQSKYYGHFDEYPIECQWNTNISMEKEAMLLMANAAEIGLTVNVKETTWALLCSDSAKVETTPDLHVLSDSSFYPEAASLIQGRYHSMTAGTWEQGEWLLDPILDKMIDDILATSDNNERYAKYREVTKYIIDLCPTIFILESPERIAYQAAYMEWPAAKGEVIPAYQYENMMRFIKVYPEKREELLKK
jgi:peptide/nickel transport system substrate-binding protein